MSLVEGQQAGKTLVWIKTFGPKALTYSKRDLAQLGLTTQAQLLSPFPPGGKQYLCRLLVALQRGDDGIERNDIKKIDQLRIVDSPTAGFTLPEEDEGGTS